MKEKLYDIATNIGMKLFAEYWGKASLKATDRYIEYPFVLENLPKPPCKILDVGCAGSMFPLILKALKYRTYGIDVRLHPSWQKFDFYEDDICKSPFDDNEFDVVTAISTIEHIKDDAKAIGEIHRILKPKGLLLMTVPCRKSIMFKSKQTKFHFIYNYQTIDKLLINFNIEIKIVHSPETDSYGVALIMSCKE